MSSIHNVVEEDSSTIASWSGEGVKLSRVAAEVERMRIEGDHLATRTSVVNLVVVAPDDESLERTASAMRRLGVRHPGRTILIRCLPEADAGIDAEVSLHEAIAEGHCIWWEEMRLVVSGGATSHLDSVVAPLLLTHLPLAAWFPGVLPTPGDPLAAAADAVLVDSRFSEPLGTSSREADRDLALAHLAELAQHHHVVDLSWKRLTPWRQLLAGLFDTPSLSDWLERIDAARVVAQPGPRRLLAGWLVASLGLPTSAVDLRDALHASVELFAQGGRGRFAAERVGDEPYVQATAEIDGEVVLSQRQGLPEHGLTWSLAQALSHLRRDLTYERALQAALGWGR